MSPRAKVGLAILAFLIAVCIYMGYLSLQAAAANIGDENQGKAMVENLACNASLAGAACPTQAPTPEETTDVTDVSNQ